MQVMEVVLILMFQTSTPSFNKTSQLLCDQISAGTLMTQKSVFGMYNLDLDFRLFVCDQLSL